MSEQHQNRSSKPLNANLVALIFIINFVVIAGLIVANTPLLSSEVSSEEERIEVALQEPTATLPQPSNTPLPPTSTPTTLPPTSTPLPPTSTPTEIPASDTPQAVADAGQAAGTDDSSYDPALVTQGETLFPQCAACHGPDARGIPNLGKDLVDSEFVAAQTDDELVQFIIMGRPIWDPENTSGIDMPPKGGNPALSTDDIHAIVAYLRSLADNGE